MHLRDFVVSKQIASRVVMQRDSIKITIYLLTSSGIGTEVDMNLWTSFDLNWIGRQGWW